MLTAGMMFEARPYEVFTARTDAHGEFIQLNWAGGYYRANRTMLNKALAMGRRGLLNRVKEVWECYEDNESREHIKRYRSLPTEILAIAVADFTFCDDWND